MTLKQKTLFTSLSTTIVFLLLIVAIVYRVVSVQFQQIENQRVDRNIDRIQAIIDDRFDQINTKLADWAIWDDTYFYLENKNKEYEISNLVQESFSNIGIDEALFIDKEGVLVSSILINDDPEKELEFPNDLYINFASGSALAKIDPIKKYNSGTLRTEDGLLLYVIRDVYKSNNTGDSTGKLVFARYLDKKILDSVRELTQFEAEIWLWDDSSTPGDYQTIKENYQQNGSKELIKILDKKFISGYLVIEDVFGKPQAIIRGDVERDITKQGLSGMILLAVMLVILGIILSSVNYLLLTGMVLKKVTLIAHDVDNLGKTDSSLKRLAIGKTTDEVDRLRQKINDMLDLLQSSKTELSDKEKFINSVLDHLPIGIAVNRISTGEAIYLNKSFEKIYGWTSDVITSVDSFFANVYPDPKTGPELKKKVLADIKSGDPARMKWSNLEITKSDGKKRFIDASNIPLPEQDLMVSTVIDITDSKQTTEDKLKRTEELEKINSLMVNRELKMIELKKLLKNKKTE